MKSKDIKLLIYGSGNVNPINIVVENILRYGLLNYQIDGLNLFEREDIKTTYNNFNSINKIERSGFTEIPLKKLISLLKLILKDNNFRTSFLSLIVKINFNKAIILFKKTINDKYYLQKHLDYFKEYNIINGHYISSKSAALLSEVPVNCKLVLSFWGSDLMNSAGVENYKALINAIERADIITLSSFEMSEIFLSKFGRKFKGKIRYTMFGQREDIFNLSKLEIENLKIIGKQIIKSSGYNLENYKYIIKVGYNGFETQNHIELITQCNSLKSSIIQDVLLVVPMTYGATYEYINRINEFSKTQKIDVCILDTYLTSNEALSLSFICDIMLNLRDNDGFNNSMIETLVAGKVLISGGWLPYSNLRKHKVHFYEIYEFEELSELINTTISNLKTELLRCDQNKNKVRNIVSGSVSGPQWEKVFAELV